MIIKSIKYTDYNGVERNEKFMFNLSQAELTEMELSAEGGLQEMLAKISKTEDGKAISNFFKDLILKSYGEKTADGRKFVKIDNDGKPLSNDFYQTEAYSVLFMELITSPEKAAEFANGILPDSIKNLNTQNNQ